MVRPLISISPLGATNRQTNRYTAKIAVRSEPSQRPNPGNLGVRDPFFLKSIPASFMSQKEEIQVSESGNATELAGSRKGISYRRLVIIMFGLCLSVFLTALDQVGTVSVYFAYTDDCFDVGADDGCGSSRFGRIYLDRCLLPSIKVPSDPSRSAYSVPSFFHYTGKHRISGAESRFSS
jgi:hypothetical protein